MHLKLWLLVSFQYVWMLVDGTTEESQKSFLDQTLFSTKTPYKLARHWFSDYVSASGIESKPLPDITEDQFYPTQCTPFQLSIVLRHGTRFPSSGDIKRTAKLLKKLEDLELREEYSAVKDWHNDFTKDNEKQLAGNGVLENIEIAKRLVRAFPALFRSSLALNGDDIADFEILSSNTQRSIDSAQAFAKGLSLSLNDVEEEWIFSHLSQRNDLLRFYERCSEYNYQVGRCLYFWAPYSAFCQFSHYRILFNLCYACCQPLLRGNDFVFAAFRHLYRRYTHCFLVNDGCIIFRVFTQMAECYHY